MSPVEIFRNIKFSVASIVINLDGKRISSGTGFVSGKRLITCAHVLDNLTQNCEIHISFEHVSDNQTPGWKFPASKLNSIRKGYSAETSFDFTILSLPTNVVPPKSLTFSDTVPEVGANVCGLGYPFEQTQLTIHSGIVSAIYDSGPVKMLKLNMSVNPSNSGGPLIDTENGHVVGIIARKAHGLSQQFDRLTHSFDESIAILEEPAKNGVLMTMGGVDPMKALVMIQRQMKDISKEIKRSANVGIGYAIWIEPLRFESGLK